MILLPRAINNQFSISCQLEKCYWGRGTDSFVLVLLIAPLEMLLLPSVSVLCWFNKLDCLRLPAHPFLWIRFYLNTAMAICVFSVTVFLLQCQCVCSLQGPCGPQSLKALSNLWSGKLDLADEGDWNHGKWGATKRTWGLTRWREGFRTTGRPAFNYMKDYCLDKKIRTLST